MIKKMDNLSYFTFKKIMNRFKVNVNSSPNAIQIRKIEFMIHRLLSDKNLSIQKIENYKTKLKDLENGKIVEEEEEILLEDLFYPIKCKSKRIFCPEYGLYKFCEKFYDTYGIEAKYGTQDKNLCKSCAGRRINGLDNFIPRIKTNLKIGRKLKCIKPINDLEMNKTYYLVNFGYKTLIVENKRKPKFIKNFSQHRFEVFVKPFGQPGEWCKIK